MIGRMIFGSQALLSNRVEAAPADFIVTSDAEWDAVFARSAAELSGKIVEISGAAFSQRMIANRDFVAAGGPVTIRSANAGSSLPSVVLDGTVRGIDFAGLNFQMTGWPLDYKSCFFLNNGTFGALRFTNGTTFRHGYGPALVDLDTGAQLAEYERIDNIRVASTVSSTHPLTWKDPAAPTGWIEFFNRGTASVRVAVGDAGVTATAASPLVAAGARLRISSGVTPAGTTHFAVLAAAGTCEVNARTEIGLTEYLAPAFASSGAATLEDIEIRNCLFRDLATGVKGLRPTQDSVIMDCDFDRIYMDIIAFPPQPGASAHVLRNLECLPFARSGIAENLDGDARDPHGDQYQTFGNGAAVMGPIFYGGNRIRVGALRDGVSSQGVFISDNDASPSYSGLYIISTMQVGGSARAIDAGEAGFPVRNVLVYGATIANWRDPGDPNQRLTLVTDDPASVYVGRSIAPNFIADAAPFTIDGSLSLGDASDPNAVLPAIGMLRSSTTRADIETAMTTAAEGAGLGAVATRDAIDWFTADPSAVIRWDNVPSGAHWNAMDNLALDAMATLPLRKILNRRAAQPVSVGNGTEWRSLAADGSTEIRGWTSLPGTIEPDQFIQIRRTAAATGGETVSAAVTINGFYQEVALTTQNAPAAFLLNPSPAAYFAAPANVPAGTSRLTFRGRFNFPTITNGMKPFTQSSTGCDLIILSNGSVTVTIEDGTGTAVLLNQVIAPPGTIIPDVWYDMQFDADHAAARATLTLNGTSFVMQFAAGGNGVFQSNRAVALLGTVTGANALPVGTRLADLSLDYNGIPFKSVSNNADIANADPWRKGGLLTNG